MREAFFAKYQDSVCNGYSEETVRKMLFSEESVRGIKKPKRPETFYRSVEEIPIESDINKEKGDVFGRKFRRRGIEVYLYHALSCVDYEGTRNPADVILLFITRKYSHTAHMKKKSNTEQRFPQFSATNTFLESIEKCNVLLGELKDLKVRNRTIRKIHIICKS